MKKTAPLIPCFCNTKRAHFQGKSKKNYQILPQVSEYVVDCQVSWCPRRLRSNLGEKTKSLPDYGVLLTAWWSACHATNIVQDYRERNTNRHFFPNLKGWGPIWNQQKSALGHNLWTRLISFANIAANNYLTCRWLANMCDDGKLCHQTMLYIDWCLRLVCKMQYSNQYSYKI